jgi:chromosome transmission fidelity protein 18
MPVDQQQASGKTKKNNSFVLLRPVICICNDLYVPALRPLRQIALILNFPRIEQTTLAKRLLTVRIECFVLTKNLFLLIDLDF